MATKDISDVQVCEAYEAYCAEEAEHKALRGKRDWFEYWRTVPTIETVDVRLIRATGQPAQAVYQSMERAAGRDLIEWGVTIRRGWLTDKGKALLAAAREGKA